MQKLVTAYYDGNQLHLHSTKEENELRDLVYSNVASFFKQRRHWLLETDAIHKMKVMNAIETIKVFVTVYKNYSVKAVTKRVVAMEEEIFLIMPRASGSQRNWYTQMETILKICRAYLKKYDHENFHQYPKR